MECFCYLRNAQGLLADGKTPHERRFGEPFQGPVIHFGVMVEYFPISAKKKNKSRLHQFLQESLARHIPRLCSDRWRNLEMRYSGRRHWGIGKHRRIRNPSSKNQCKRSFDATKERKIRVPSSRWHRKTVSQRSRIPRTHSKAGTTCGERSSQWRTSRRTGRAPTDRNKRWRWSPERLLVDWRWFHLSSSYWTSSSSLCCVPKEKIPIPLKKHWRDQINSHKSGCDARNAYQRLLANFVRFVDRIHEIHVIGWETSSRACVVWWAPDKDPSNCQNMCGLRFGLACRKQQEKQDWAVEKPKLDNAGKLRGTNFIDPEDEEHQETIEKNARKKLETPMEAATPCKMETRERFKDLLETVASGTLTHTRKPKCTCIVEAHESTRKRLECTLPRNHEDGQGDGVPKAGPQQAAADPRVPNLRVCEHLPAGVAHSWDEGRINVLPWYLLVGVASTRKGKWPPRGTEDDSPHLSWDAPR